jgi:hypothetical protein
MTPLCFPSRWALTLVHHIEMVCGNRSKEPSFVTAGHNVQSRCQVFEEMLPQSSHFASVRVAREQHHHQSWARINPTSYPHCLRYKEALSGTEATASDLALGIFRVSICPCSLTHVPLTESSPPSCTTIIFTPLNFPPAFVEWIHSCCSLSYNVRATATTCTW